MKIEEKVPTENLTLLARKKWWVPMWFCIHVILRFNFYDEHPDLFKLFYVVR